MLSEKPSLLPALDQKASLDDIRRLLAQGADPNETDAAGRTPMSVAVAQELWYAADLLLDAGAAPPTYPDDPNGTVQFYDDNFAGEAELETVLTNLIWDANSYRPIFDVLSNGADVNGANSNGETPLYLAVHGRKWPFVAVQLVKRGAWIRPDKPDPDEVVDIRTGATRLLSVILEGVDAKAVETILASGADPNKADRTGLTPLALARALKWPAVEEMLIARGAWQDAAFPNPNQLVGERNDTPLLCYAAGAQCCHDNYKIALLEHGADPNAVDATGKAPAHWAALSGATAFFQALEKAGADIFVPGTKDEGMTPLHWACMRNNIDIVRHILSVCPTSAINQSATKGQTPLHFAASKSGHAELAQLLLDAGAFVNVRGTDGQTPLSKAIAARDPRLVRLLIENGADVGRPSEGENCAEHLFLLTSYVNKETLEILQLLLDHGADPNVRASAAVDYRAAQGETLVFFAAGGPLEILRRLLAAGADPNTTSCLGESPVHRCLNMRRPEAIQLFLDYGFDPLKVYDYTFTYDGGTDRERKERHVCSAYDYARELAEKFPNTKCTEMLTLIEKHLAEKKARATAWYPKKAADGPRI